MPSHTATCTKCGRTWTGVTQAHCTVCHEHFSTVKNFDAHRVARPPRKCASPATQLRTKRDGTKVPILKSVPTVHGPLWISTDGDDRDHDEKESTT